MEEFAIKLIDIKKEFRLPTLVKNTLIDHLKNPFQKTEIQTYEVLKDIDLTINKGDFIGILGVNGSGKSTLLKIIAGVYVPTSGSVQVNGTLVPFLELGVGFNPELTGRENIFLNGIILGMKKKFLEEHFKEIVDFAELERFMDLPLKNFSSGMQVRLAFSIAMMADADIYLLDEVLAVGDQHFQEKCINIFKKYKNYGKTIVLVTHSAASIKELCNRAVLIKDGTITADGTPNDVLSIY
jgi:ABC-2 type transport system ATP-binding protein